MQVIDLATERRRRKARVLLWKLGKRWGKQAVQDMIATAANVRATTGKPMSQLSIEGLLERFERMTRGLSD